MKIGWLAGSKRVMRGSLTSSRSSGRPQLVLQVVGFQQRLQLGAEGEVRAGQAGQGDDVDVLVEGHARNGLRRLPQAGVDDLHAGVHEGAHDDLGALVVAVEAGLGQQHLDAPCWGD